MSPNTSLKSTPSPDRPDPVTDFLTRERAAMEAMEGESGAAQGQDHHPVEASPSLPFPYSPTSSDGSSISNQRTLTMDAVQLQMLAEWREEFERMREDRVQQDKKGKLELADQAAKDAADWRRRHEEEVQGNREKNKSNAQNVQQGAWLRALDGKPLDVNVLKELALPGSPAAERVLKALLCTHSDG
jgi:hypothetical protein